MECCVEGVQKLFGRRLERSSTEVLQSVSTDWVALNMNRTASKGYTVKDESVGEGGFGSVCKVVDKKTGVEMVMKTMAKDRIPDMNVFRNEIQFQSGCDHPHIARLLEIFETEEKISIVMEMCSGGEILDIITDEGVVSELDAWHVFQQLMSAIYYLHTIVHLAHRDLKPENFLVKEAGLPLHKATMKLIDFGFAQRFEPGCQSLSTKCGTPFYMCPELLQGPYDEKCDIWACGVILYLLLSGELPFYAEDTREILELARQGDLTFAEPAWANVDPSAQTLISSMCSLDPAARPSAQQVQEDAWMQRTREEVQKSTPPSPTKSVGEVARSLKRFQKMNKFKKLALGAMGHILEDKDIGVLRNTFEMLDVEGDGVIEVKSMKKALSDAGLPAANVEAMCKGVAQDGRISYSAFLAANVKRENYTKESYCWEAFRMLDKDGNGCIDLDEFKMLMGKTESLQWSEEQAREAFSKIDTSGDGQVDFEEFMAAMRTDDGTRYESFGTDLGVSRRPSIGASRGESFS